MPRPFALLCGREGPESVNWQQSWGAIARSRRDLAIPPRSGAAPWSNSWNQGWKELLSCNAQSRVLFYVPGDIVRTGGCRICDLAEFLGWDCKISPRSSHPSPQQCCIPSESFLPGFTHTNCGDHVPPFQMREPYRWWSEKEKSAFKRYQSAVSTVPALFLLLLNQL